jgi:putative PEP-CTERM system TPR-repeat lipoprotein
MQLGAMHGRRGDYAKAADVLKRAQKIAPANPTITRDLVVAYLRLGRPDDAVREAKALQAAAPTNAAGFLLEGDVQATRKNWPAAEAAYRAGLKLEPTSGLLATKLHGALAAADRKAEADALAKKWLADHPKDAAMRGYLAERALQARDYKTAVAQYEAVVAIDPNNIVVLNNLAFAAGRVGDPRAITYAERAATLAPRNAAVLDTFGMLLIAKGDTDKGLDYLARASALAPGRHDIRLNYAKALAKAGQKDAARQELERLQAVRDDFPGKAEIPELLRGL